MKIASTVVVGLILAHQASSFVPNARSRSQPSQVAATSDDVPDIVQAYKKAKAVDSFQDIKLPSSTEVPQPPPIDTAPVASTASSNVESYDLSVAVDTVKSSIPDIPTPDSPVTESVSNAAALKLQFVNEFLEAAKEGYQTKISSIATTPRATNDNIPTLMEFMRKRDMIPQRSTFTETVAAPQGKAPTLGEYFAQRVAGGGPSVYDETQVSNAATAKAKIGLMISNTYALFGLDAPKGVTSTESSVSAMPTLDNLPEGTAGWSVAVLALVIAAGQRQAGVSDVKSQMENMVQKEADAVSELAAQVRFMSEEIKKLNAQTGDLRRELVAAQEKLSQKELEISKERLKVADKELVANRKVEKLETKLRESDFRIKSMESELAETRDIRDQLATALNTVKSMEGELKTAGSEKMVKQIKEVLAPRVNGGAPAEPEPVKTEAKTKGATRKKKATKGAKSPVKKVRVTKGSKSATAKAKVEVKKSTKAKKSPKKQETGKSWSELSQSTLSRKTVKELKEYLDDKGVSTTSNDGKTLKKAMLVEAVLSL